MYSLHFHDIIILLESTKTFHLGIQYIKIMTCVCVRDGSGMFAGRD